jgi:hypothetical protein
MSEIIARAIARSVVQSLADSEPSERSMDGMELLSSTPLESMFVLDGLDIEEAVEMAICNAVFDGALSVPSAGTTITADTIFSAIKHGDDDHQAWLKSELDRIFTATP